MPRGGRLLCVAAGYYHDHLFVPDGEEDRVMELLQILAASVMEEKEEESGSSTFDETV